MKNRDSFIFYRSFFEAIENLDLENQAKIYHAICAYNFNQVEPNFTGICLTVWILIKPQLDANIKRFNNGNTPKKSNQEAKRKQKPSKGQANNNNNVNNNENENDNNNEIINQSFLMFWDMYDHKQDRKKCESIWSKIPTTEYSRIFAHVPTYVKSTPDKQFRKHPKTYLNQEAWNNEVIAPAVSKPEEKYVSKFKDLGW